MRHPKATRFCCDLVCAGADGRASASCATASDLLHAIYGRPARSRPIRLLSCGFGCPLGTVVDRELPLVPAPRRPHSQLRWPLPREGSNTRSDPLSVGHSPAVPALGDSSRPLVTLGACPAYAPARFSCRPSRSSKHRGTPPSRGLRSPYTMNHAAEPHRGRITEGEKRLVWERLEEVNARLRREGHKGDRPEGPQDEGAIRPID